MDLLVIEDDESVRELIVATLTGAGYGVTTAEDGLDGLSKLDRMAPAAVLLDVNMPRMDGFSVLERLQGDERFRELPVLMLTARSSPEDIRRAIHLGARDYIGKPFEPRQLLRRVDRMVNT